MARGRPSDFNPIIAEAMCEEIASGSNIKKLAGTGMYPSEPTIYKWMKDNEDFLKQYLASRAIRAHARSDRMDDIVDRMVKGLIEPNVASVALTSERWQAGREAPRVYGDKIEIDQTVTQKPAEVDWTGVESEDVAIARDILARATSPKPTDKSKLNGQTKH